MTRRSKKKIDTIAFAGVLLVLSGFLSGSSPLYLGDVVSCWRYGIVTSESIS